MIAETAQLPRSEGHLVIARDHGDRSGQHKDARRRWRIVLAQFRTRDHRDQGLPQRAIVDEDVGAPAVRVIVREP